MPKQTAAAAIVSVEHEGHPPDGHDGLDHGRGRYVRNETTESHSIQFWGPLCFCSKRGLWSKSMLRGLKQLCKQQPTTPYIRMVLNHIARGLDPRDIRACKGSQLALV
jgi:hypothetical protein